jgi:predicted transcriptional regulator
MGRRRKPITQRKIMVLCARVSSTLRKKIESIAVREDRTKAQIVRAALREYMQRQKQERE